MKCFVICLIFSSLINEHQFELLDIFRGLPKKRCPPPELYSDGIRTLKKDELSEAYESVQFSRHHIIPYKRLRDFYDTVMERSRLAVEYKDKIILKEVRKFFHTINETIYFNPTYKGLNYNYLEVQPFFDYILTSPLKSLSDAQELAIGEAQKNIACAFVWLPSDVFIGPSPEYRTDDPEDNFEYDAVVVVGYELHRYLQELRDLMKRYVQWKNPPDNSMTIAQIMQAITDFLYKIKNSEDSRPYFDFEEEDWELVQKGTTGITKFKLRGNDIKRKRIIMTGEAVEKIPVKEWASILKNSLKFFL